MGSGKHTGTINKVEKKLHRNSRRKGSDGRSFPSMLIVLGTSGMRPMTALKNASAAREKSEDEPCETFKLGFSLDWPGVSLRAAWKSGNPEGSVQPVRPEEGSSNHHR